MNRALAASLIFLGVFAVAGLHAWVLYGRTKRRLDDAALQELEGDPPVPGYSRLQVRLYFGAVVVQFALLAALAVVVLLVGEEGEPPPAAAGPLFGAFAASVLARIVGQNLVDWSTRRTRRKRLLGSGDAG